MSRPMNENGGLKGFFDKHLFTIIIGTALVYSNFQSANSVTSIEVVEVKRRLGVIEDDVRYLRNRAIERDVK